MISISEHIAFSQQIMEIIQTGDLQRLRYERTDSVAITNLFYGIYGVGALCLPSSPFSKLCLTVSIGRQTAYKWFVRGCRTLEDLSQGKNGVRLSEVQSIGLKYYNG